MSEARILVVDDESDVRDLVGGILADAGHGVTAVASGTEALAALANGHVDLVTLDVNLADESGYEVCASIRAVSNVPVLLLTARSDEFDEVFGLSSGADAFLSKPFSRRLLLAHVSALLRRGSLPADPALLRSGNVGLDPVGRRAYVGEQELELSKTEFDLLAVFLAEPARAFPRDALIARVWGEWYSDDHVIDVTMGRLRRKLADAGADDIIETLRGVGYRLRGIA